MRSTKQHVRSVRGVTLVELVIAIVIFGIAVTALMGAMSAVAKTSAERMIRDQAESIAQAYLQRVASAQFDTSADGISAWNGFTQVGAYDQFGNSIAGLDQFQIAISVQNVALGAPAVPANNTRRIDVTVTHASGVAVASTAFRTRRP